MVVALLVTLISFIVVSAVLAQSLHNISQAGYMRRRLSAVSAAEAGLNWYWRTLELTTLTGLQTSGWSEVPAGSGLWQYTGTATSSVASGPDAPVFRLRVRYFKENPCANPTTGAARTCTATGLTVQSLTEDPFPSTIFAIVRSIGCVGNDCASATWPTNSSSVRRALESVMRLRSRYGGVSGTVTASYVCLDQAADLRMDGDLYVLGQAAAAPPGWPAECSAGVVVGSGDKLTMTGSLYSGDGNITTGTGSDLDVSGDIFAAGSVVLGSGTSTAPVCDGTNDATCGCSDPNVKLCVRGNVTGSAVTVGSQAAVLGDISVCSPACPPATIDFPKIVWDEKDWANWTIHDNATVASAISGLASPMERSVYRVTQSPCVIHLSGSYAISVDIAIVGSKCSFELDSGTTFTGTGTVLLMSLWPGTPASVGSVPASDCGGGSIEGGTVGGGFTQGQYDIYIHNNPDTAGPNFFFYTPCSLKIDNNSATPVKGQLVARYLWIKNGADVTNVSVSGGGGIDLPGIVTGFSQDVRYINEISVTLGLS